MHLLEHALELLLERLVLGALVELADEVAAGLEGVGGEYEGCVAEVLFAGRNGLLVGMSVKNTVVTGKGGGKGVGPEGAGDY